MPAIVRRPVEGRGSSLPYTKTCSQCLSRVLIYSPHVNTCEVCGTRYDGHGQRLAGQRRVPQEAPW